MRQFQHGEGALRVRTLDLPIGATLALRNHHDKWESRLPLPDRRTKTHHELIQAIVTALTGPVESDTSLHWSRKIFQPDRCLRFSGVAPASRGSFPAARRKNPADFRPDDQRRSIDYFEGYRGRLRRDAAANPRDAGATQGLSHRTDFHFTIRARSSFTSSGRTFGSGGRHGPPLSPRSSMQVFITDTS